jgi:hypothetical protein
MPAICTNGRCPCDNRPRAQFLGIQNGQICAASVLIGLQLAQVVREADDGDRDAVVLERPDGKRQHTAAEIAEAVGVHRTTVYDYLKKER